MVSDDRRPSNPCRRRPRTHDPGTGQSRCGNIRSKWRHASSGVAEAVMRSRQRTLIGSIGRCRSFVSPIANPTPRYRACRRRCIPGWRSSSCLCFALANAGVNLTVADLAEVRPARHVGAARPRHRKADRYRRRDLACCAARLVPPRTRGFLGRRRASSACWPGSALPCRSSSPCSPSLRRAVERGETRRVAGLSSSRRCSASVGAPSTFEACAEIKVRCLGDIAGIDGLSGSSRTERRPLSLG